MDKPSPPTGMSPPVKRMVWAWGLSIVAVWNGGCGSKIVPGGPFISVIWDILPSLFALTAIGLSLRNIRERPGYWIASSLVAITLSNFALANVISSVVTFWHRPYARGVLIGL